ncbi:expressed unknown protein [Seminavis robusta]|uniref:CRAL-TRIO domain-containing protein n=1 Tax=Seminavis robusta TaxID=568900 RepID=A0A9N8ER09_9STRA|nr:expressed unknown protein [Seminavis robusta]|eukprot:Sro1472_g275550.1 n/a (296) ;mRNA; r:26061-26948
MRSEARADVLHAVDDSRRKRKLTEFENPTMKLTDQEREYALKIKRALEEEDEVLARAISDMEIASYAIVDQGDLERSLERAECMQAFRMDYNISDTVEDGIQVLRTFQELCPGMLLSIDPCTDGDSDNGSHVVVLDLTKNNPLSFLKSPKNFRYAIGGIYYMIRCMQPDLKSVREGYRQILECDGIGWNNLSSKVDQRCIDELLHNLPHRRKSMKILRASPIMLVIGSLMKPFLPKEEYDAIIFGFQNQDATEFPERLDNYFLQPDPEAAFEGLMRKCQSYLTKRAETEKSFKLD